MKIAILGGGHGCYAAAADLSEQGHEVRLWRRDAAALQPVIDSRSIRLADAQCTPEIGIALATGDIAAALDGAELIVLPTPAIAQEDIARAMAAHLTDGQVVFLAPGTFGSYVMAKIVHDSGNHAAVTFAETGTLPYLARKHASGEVAITIRATRLPTGVFPACRSCACRAGTRLSRGGTMRRCAVRCVDECRTDHPPLIIMNAAPLQHFPQWDIHILTPIQQHTQVVSIIRIRSVDMFKTTMLAALVAGTMMQVQAADKIKIGFLSTLSGPAAVLGTSVQDGFNLAIKKLGGKVGGLPVEVVVQDDQGKPDVAHGLGEKLIKKEKVDFLTGMIFQNILTAVDKYTFASETFLISPNTGPSYLAGESCNPYFFAASWVSDSYSEATGQYVTQKGLKNVFIVAPNYTGGKDVVAGFKRFYKGKIAEESYVKMGELDFAAELAQIRAAKPDAVFFFLPGGMGINFMKQWKQSGLGAQFPLFATGWNFDQDTLNALGESTLGSQHAAHWNSDFDNPQSKQFVADFEKEYKRLPSVYASQGYDTAMLIDAAVRDVKGKVEDKAALRKALEAANFKSVRGDFKFNTNHFPIQTYYSQVVVKDATGRMVNKTTGKIFENHPDAYVANCKMK